MSKLLDPTTIHTMTRISVKNIFKYYWPTMLVVAFILYATLWPNPAGAEELPPIPYIDKFIHAIMMGTLLITFSYDWQRENRQTPLTPSFVWAVFGCIIAFSFADELLQHALDNGRTGDPFDFLADCIGAIIAVYIAPPIIRRILHVARHKAA